MHHTANQMKYQENTNTCTLLKCLALVTQTYVIHRFRLGSWCLKPLSTIVQLYRGDQFY
jgi:hypothetical protein